MPASHPTLKEFPKHSLVAFSDEWYEHTKHEPDYMKTRYKGRKGWVAGHSRDKESIRVHWKGTSITTASTYSKKFLKRI